MKAAKIRLESRLQQKDQNMFFFFSDFFTPPFLGGTGGTMKHRFEWEDFSSEVPHKPVPMCGAMGWSSLPLGRNLKLGSASYEQKAYSFPHAYVFGCGNGRAKDAKVTVIPSP